MALKYQRAHRNKSSHCCEFIKELNRLIYFFNEFHSNTAALNQHRQRRTMNVMKQLTVSGTNEIKLFSNFVRISERDSQGAVAMLLCCIVFNVVLSYVATEKQS